MINIKHFGALLAILVLVQCSSAQTTKEQSKNQDAMFSKASKVEWSENSGNYYVNIKTGENIVFELTQATGGDPRNDTQIKTVVVFEIPAETSSFEYNSEWGKHSAFLLRQCRCIDAGYNLISSGKISGTKKDNSSWQISVDIEATGNDSGEKYHFQYEGQVSHK